MKLLLMERKPRLGLLLFTIEDKTPKKRLARRTAMDNQTTSTMCPHWVSTQDQLFQYAHICFVVAFCAPRIYKPSILFFRLLLALGFLLSAFWAGVHVCFYDAFVWNMLLLAVNSSHAGALVSIFLPPALSIELTELYIRVFKPVKVNKKQFKELTREATLCKLGQRESYAVEKRTLAHERLSILLRGKMSVTCDGMHLHDIFPFQFVDSPEYMCCRNPGVDVCQVSITAEEDCLYLCWPRNSLDRLFKHRSMLKSVFDSLIGKDITQKLYSLNELIPSHAQNSAEPLRLKLNRSVSVDAVNTSSRGQVRSINWRSTHGTIKNLFSNISQNQSPVRSSHEQCWVPIVASQFPAVSPFTIAEETPRDSLAFPEQPTSKCVHSRTSSLKSRVHSTSIDRSRSPTSSPVTLLPVMVPLLAAPNLPPLSNKRQREVKFNESIL